MRTMDRKRQPSSGTLERVLRDGEQMSRISKRSGWQFPFVDSRGAAGQCQERSIATEKAWNASFRFQRLYAYTFCVHRIQSCSSIEYHGTQSTVEVTTNSTTVMMSFLRWIIRQYIVLAPTSIYNKTMAEIGVSSVQCPLEVDYL